MAASTTSATEMQLVIFDLWLCRPTRSNNINFMHKRAKPRNGVAPYAVDDEFDLVIICTCRQDHEPLTVDFNQKGEPKKTEGNDACWLGLFEFCTGHLAKTPEKKLLQNWKQCLGDFHSTGYCSVFCQASLVCLLQKAFWYL